MALQSISRKEAAASGASFYFTGLPCKHGHIAERSVLDRGCRECRKEIGARHSKTEKRKNYCADYCRRTDVKERIKRRNQRPEVIEKRRAYLTEYENRPEIRKRRRKLNRAWRAKENAKLGSNTWVLSLLHHAKKRAQKAGIPIDIQEVREFLSNPPTHCPVFGWKFNPGGGKRTEDSPSLDRIRPELGYVRGNIALLSVRANRIKSDASAAEIRAVADWLETTGV